MSLYGQQALSDRSVHLWATLDTSASAMPLNYIFLRQDMYAYSIASSQLDAGPIQYELHQELMAQPPFDPFLEIQAGNPYHHNAQPLQSAWS